MRDTTAPSPTSRSTASTCRSCSPSRSRPYSSRSRSRPGTTYGRSGRNITAFGSGRTTRPWPHSHRPAVARNSAVLPAPLGPVTSSRLPSGTSSDNSRTSGRPLGPVRSVNLS